MKSKTNILSSYVTQCIGSTMYIISEAINIQSFIPFLETSMIRVIFVQLILVYFFSPSVSFCGDENQRIYFKSYKCKFSEKFAYQNHSCFAKSFNRTCSTVTLQVTAKMPLSHIIVWLSQAKFNTSNSLFCHYRLKPKFFIDMEQFIAK